MLPISEQASLLDLKKTFNKIILKMFSMPSAWNSHFSRSRNFRFGLLIVSYISYCTLPSEHFIYLEFYPQHGILLLLHSIGDFLKPFNLALSSSSGFFSLASSTLTYFVMPINLFQSVNCILPVICCRILF